MALLKSLSIKWKLSLALIGTGLALVSAYVVIAKSTFESDKISYVYDSQGARLESLRSELQSKLERAFLGARSVVGNFDFSSGKPTALGEQFFNEEKQLLAVELSNEQKAQTVFHLEKQGASLPPFNADTNTKAPLGQLDLEPLDSRNALLTVRYSQGDQGIFRLRAMIDTTNLLPANATQSVALAKSGRVILVSDLRNLGNDLFNEVAAQSKHDDRTKMFEHGIAKYLVSESEVGLANLQLFALTPESEALGALTTLYTRSMVFLISSFFALVAISLTLARSLTRTLVVLTKSAEEIGAGNFDAAPSINTKDEMGVLARAFSKMSQEIKRLLIETRETTREKTRMEEELKTASLIQERLMPKQATADVGEIEISGLVITSSECGGDWWYYFKRGDDIFVAIADATGHGTPAALITAAARSCFARLETEDLSLIEMLKAWDISVSGCSQRQVFMTGLLFRINTVTGEGAFVNAAHESPYVLRANEDGTFALDHLPTDTTARIGDDIRPDLKEEPFSLAPNESIILYTDGLFSVVREGKALSERRFGKNLATRAEFLRSAKDLTQATLSAFNEHRKDLPLPDDVSIVAIRRKGPHKKSFLENDTGEVHVST